MAVDEIAEQLRSEIHSLEEYIQRTENRFLAAQWTGELVDPFEAIEDRLPDDELRDAILAFHYARTHFQVNGHLADRIDAILERHAGLVADLPAADSGDGGDERVYDEIILSPAADPGDTTPVDEAGSLFQEEDEEELAIDAPLFDEEDEEELAIDAPLLDEEDEEEQDEGNVSRYPETAASADDIFADQSHAEDGDVGAIEVSPDDDLEAAALPDPDDAEPGDTDDLFSINGDAADIPEAGTPKPQQTAATLPTTPAAGDGQAPTDDLFAAGVSEKGSGRAIRREVTPPTSKIRDASLAGEGKTEAELYSIFSHTVSLDDIAAGLDIDIPAQDRTGLEQKLRARLQDRVVASLRGSKMAESQYILLPRVARFTNRAGKTVPCTVKNLVKQFVGMFYDIRELMPYRNEHMMSSEVPTPGWALVTPESPRESLGKNYMDQQQYLRYLSTSLGIPSHLIGRRTMVEAIYDLIVGELALGIRFQRSTLDWTASSRAKNDFVCVYYPDEGIRIRDLSRTTHHGSLGVTPSW